VITYFDAKINNGNYFIHYVSTIINDIMPINKADLLEKIPVEFCEKVMNELNIQYYSTYSRTHTDCKLILKNKINYTEAMYVYRKWNEGISAVDVVKYLKKPNSTALSVLISMNLRKKGYIVGTEILLNGRQCDVIAVKGKNRANEIWAIELKSPRDNWKRGIDQCMDYSIWSDKSILAVMGYDESTLFKKTKSLPNVFGIATIEDMGELKIIRNPLYTFKIKKESFNIFSVIELKKIIRSKISKCPDLLKRGLIDFLFSSLSQEELESIFRLQFHKKVVHQYIFNLTSIELNVLSCYFINHKRIDVQKEGGMVQFIKNNNYGQGEVEEFILSELIEQGVLPTIVQ